MATTYTYDLDSARASLSDASGLAEYRYEGGQVLHAIHHNGDIQTIARDAYCCLLLFNYFLWYRPNNK